jgi:RNA 2',3'-cyclic 3'-phosphodiesterase
MNAGSPAPAAPQPTAVAADAQRLFVAIRIAPAAANQLAQTADQLARRANNNKIDVRWVAPVNYHITLAYLGWARALAHEAVVDVMDEMAAGLAPFELRLSKLGGFPNAQMAKVLWAGVEDASGHLDHMVGVARSRLAKLGFTVADADRPFHPHVTLGRLTAPGPISDLILPWAEQMFSICVVGSVYLLNSSGKSSAYVYDDVAKKVLDSADHRLQKDIRRHTEQVLTSATTHGDSHKETETDDGWPRGQGPSYDS